MLEEWVWSKLVYRRAFLVIESRDSFCNAHSMI